eukprot:Gregarina_sp_Poly_1__2337@NODE_1624_length_3685_cov_330_950802_g1071_i0_p1_GENE_NODE_1624_length_3685_cov_330_950802_g1071_i0NODE_1624_length_3685_cov_330_950802_g1071_i0_p1_ORF_typecomplete_len944_score184_73eIF3c_N/PF05470_12/6_1e131PCI/PF01399_27/1_3e04PCI/PF01399_27/8_9e08DUF842/PF05811_13/3_5e02DUF842/PF05811_13/0_22FUSC/PF04632_12/11FUSC/PF04632_12/0_41MCU/PF04678_13/1_2e02MCU/PF04678_13/6_3_NODE_1624_length_3685_cov_330_950802_g1071_i06213452
MGRFWGGDDSSDGVSGSEVGSDVEDTKAAQQPATRTTHKSWASMDGMSSEDEESKRVIKSEKDKRWDALRDCVKKLSQHMKSSDYVEVHQDFESLMKLVAKAQNVIDTEGAPNFLIRTLVELETYIDERQKDKAAMKKCSKQRAQAVNKLQRKMPVALKMFRELMDHCVQSPREFDSALEEDSELSDDGQSDTSSSVTVSDRPERRQRALQRDSDSGEHSSSSSSGSESDSDASDFSASDARAASSGDSGSDSESSDESVSSRSSSSSSSSSSTSEKSIASSVGDFETKHAKAMIKWGYKGKTPGVVEQKAQKKEAAAAKRREDVEKRKAAKDKAKETLAAVAETRRASLMLAGGADLDDKQILTRAQDIVAVRGKRGQERIEQVTMLRRLRDMSQLKRLAQTTFEITVYLVTLGLDLSATGGLPPATAQWQEVHGDLCDILDLLLANPDAKFQLSSTSEALADSEQALAAEEGEDQLVKSHKEHQNLRSIILSFIERLDDHLLKALQAADPHTKEYQDRLIQTVDMVALLWKAWVFYNSKVFDKPPESYRTALKLIEHLYYLPDRLAISKWKLVERRISESKSDISAAMENFQPPTDRPSQAVQDLCQYVIKTCPPSAPRIILRAYLSAIYNLAISDEFWTAHLLFTSSNLNELATAGDVADQILYNRTLTQIGLAAFRQGKVQLSFQSLADICGSNKQRELLAQGVSVVKGYEKTAEQEKAERRRLLPAHMHINLDVVETVYNICAMLIEIPTMCGSPQNYDFRSRPSRFRRALEQFEKSSTPPESSRESVIAGAKCLLKGDWAGCKNFIFKLAIWDSVNPAETREAVQNLILHHIKSVALKAYILTYSPVYDSMSVQHICTMFELDRDDVYSLVSKMIVSQELSAFWDAESETILINRTQPTKLQSSALTLVDQISALLDQSETLQSTKLGTSRRTKQVN